MMKKHFLLYILIFVIIFCCFIYAKTNKSENQKNEVVFWTLQLSTFDKYINNIISEFEKENPTIKIKWIDIPYSEGEKRTLASILTDNPPDLVNLTPDFSLLLAQKNALYTIDKEDLKDYLPSILETLKYNDKYFGIPFYATTAVTLYNKEILKGNPPKTYDELLSSKNRIMLNLAENDTLLKILNKYNINSPETINNDKSIKLFELIKKDYLNGNILKESLTQTHRDSLEKYMSGQISILVTGANFINMIKENAPSIYKNTEISYQLVGDTNAYDYSLMNFVIPKKAHNKEIALKFAIYLTNKTNQLEFAKLTTILPVNKYALKDDYFTKEIDNTIETKARIISAIQLNNTQPPIKNIKNKKELNILSANAIQEILINNADIELTLNNLSENWEKL
ncbi:MAG: extracellular solute-binding protein [Cyanobacteria bacterium SIG29]|nr:extracellular solute-binding protein [Cyanobacteria bacterium SIG29]